MYRATHLTLKVVRALKILRVGMPGLGYRPRPLHKTIADTLQYWRRRSA